MFYFNIENEKSAFFLPCDIIHFHYCCVQQGLTLQSSQAVANAKQLHWPLCEVTSGGFETKAPGGYKFYLEDKAQPDTGNTCFQSFKCIPSVCFRNHCICLCRAWVSKV